MIDWIILGLCVSAGLGVAMTILRLIFHISMGRPKSIPWKFDPTQYQDAYISTFDGLRFVANIKKDEEL